MGHLHVVADIGWKRRLKTRMLVDTGATHSVLPIDLARRLGIPKSPRKIKVELAGGTRKDMGLGTIVVRLLGREAGDTVLLAPRGTEPLLGVEALEALGLAVDPTRRKLKPSRARGVLLVGVRTLRR
ncbi:MAG: aspartyl protease family protein [Planctomycetes bacterium]|nr:aspartyl protease family protein [Planctomycetota bacterium]